MKKIIFTIAFFCLSTALFAQNTEVVFQCDMGAQVFKGFFNPATDVLVVRGSFQEDAGDPGGNWQGEFFTMTDGNSDTIYTVSANIPSSHSGTNYEFKFVIAPDEWEGAPNRNFTLASSGPQVLPKYWYNDDSSYTVFQMVTNTLNFTADIQGILGIGAGGAFDPAQDSLLVMGLDWDNLGSNLVGNRTMEVDPFNASIYRTSLTVTSGSATVGQGDSTKWKFKAFPDNRFSNDGWETGQDRWHIYQQDGATIDLPTIVPRIYPLFGALQNDVEVTFNVDMSAPVNRYNSELIDPSTLEFVGMRGGAEFLGSWSSGCWCPNDTIPNPKLMWLLTDLGNNIWSRTVIVPAGEPGGVFEYKYAMMYPGADTVNGGSSPLDNEGGFGVNHQLVLVDGPPIVLNNVFGDFTSSVERLDDLLPGNFALEQNYPNPFNPSTTIRYTIPDAGLVTLKIYNLLGQEVMTLVNEEQTSGVYEVKLNAKFLSSGIYFYTLNTGNMTATKKMIMLK